MRAESSGFLTTAWQFPSTTWWMTHAILNLLPPPPTSLVLKGESVPTRCPRTPYDIVCREAPELRFPSSCDTWSCTWCGPRIASRRAGVLAWAEPARFVTLTQAPDEWQRLRAKVRKLSLKVRSEGYRTEWAWTVERGSQTGMIHVHALQHGDFIPQRALQSMWGKRVDIRAIRSATGAAKYSMKEARRVAGYAVKNSHADLLGHLALNGGRGYHMSRKYLRGKTTREVEAIVRPPDPNRTWIVIPAETSLSDGRALAISSL
jgi:hypothetical protein